MAETPHRSWNHLEKAALGLLPPDEMPPSEDAVRDPVIAARRAHIEADRPRLRPLPPARAPRGWGFMVWAAAGATALFLGVVAVQRPVDPADDAIRALGVSGSKGTGAHVVLIRKRGPRVRRAPQSLRPGDQVQFEITCTPPRRLPIDVAVHTGQGMRRLAPAVDPIACGNLSPVDAAYEVPSEATRLCLLAGDAPLGCWPIRREDLSAP